ncbi:hypothetical protein BA062_32865 [Prauserella flavalba]|uniref:Uncharacterized protein n=1 Tax=Prauserella flavalba TaxID=1477506 RepID=A0A318LHP5_9PSEU|nr:hypothetical protein BA062_32865 [Prauserella flavalba]
MGDLTLRHVGRTRVRIDTEIEGERVAATGWLKTRQAEDMDWDTNVVTTAQLEIGRVELHDVPIETVVEIPDTRNA